MYHGLSKLIIFLNFIPITLFPKDHNGIPFINASELKPRETTVDGNYTAQEALAHSLEIQLKSTISFLQTQKWNKVFIIYHNAYEHSKELLVHDLHDFDFEIVDMYRIDHDLEAFLERPYSTGPLYRSFKSYFLSIYRKLGKVIITLLPSNVQIALTSYYSEHHNKQVDPLIFIHIRDPLDPELPLSPHCDYHINDELKNFENHIGHFHVLSRILLPTEPPEDEEDEQGEQGEKGEGLEGKRLHGTSSTATNGDSQLTDSKKRSPPGTAYKVPLNGITEHYYYSMGYSIASVTLTTHIATEDVLKELLGDQAIDCIYPSHAHSSGSQNCELSENFLEKALAFEIKKHNLEHPPPNSSKPELKFKKLFHPTITQSTSPFQSLDENRLAVYCDLWSRLSPEGTPNLISDHFVRTRQAATWIKGVLAYGINCKSNPSLCLLLLDYVFEWSGLHPQTNALITTPFFLNEAQLYLLFRLSIEITNPEYKIAYGIIMNTQLDKDDSNVVVFKEIATFSPINMSDNVSNAIFSTSDLNEHEIPMATGPDSLDRYLPIANYVEETPIYYPYSKKGSSKNPKLLRQRATYLERPTDSHILQTHNIGAGWLVIILSITLLFVSLSFLTFIFTFVWRDNQIFKVCHPLSIQITCLSMFLKCISVLSSIHWITPVTCAVKAGASVLGDWILLIVLAIKAIRLILVTESTHQLTSRWILSDRGIKLVLPICILLIGLIFTLLAICTSTFDPRELFFIQRMGPNGTLYFSYIASPPHEHRLSDALLHAYVTAKDQFFPLFDYLTCNNRHHIIAISIFNIFGGAILFLIAYRSRKTPSLYNDSRFIIFHSCMVIYTQLLVLILTHIPPTDMAIYELFMHFNNLGVSALTFSNLVLMKVFFIYRHRGAIKTGAVTSVDVMVLNKNRGKAFVIKGNSAFSHGMIVGRSGVKNAVSYCAYDSNSSPPSSISSLDSPGVSMDSSTPHCSSSDIYNRN